MKKTLVNISCAVVMVGLTACANAADAAAGTAAVPPSQAVDAQAYPSDEDFVVIDGVVFLDTCAQNNTSCVKDGKCTTKDKKSCPACVKNLKLADPAAAQKCPKSKLMADPPSHNCGAANCPMNKAMKSANCPMGKMMNKQNCTMKTDGTMPDGSTCPMMGKGGAAHSHDKAKDAKCCGGAPGCPSLKKAGATAAQPAAPAAADAVETVTVEEVEVDD